MQNKSYLWALGGIVIVIGLFIWLALAPKKPVTTRTNREVALLCTTDMATAFHIHPVLSIVINGKAEVMPSGIGISALCMNSLHTHDQSGTIHVESPEQRDFTLSDFFAVWNKTFSKDQILDSKVDATHEITVTVNGTKVDTYENTVLSDKDQIVISYAEKK